MKDFESY